MYYVSFEIETPIECIPNDSYRDKLLNVRTMFLKRKMVATKDGSWFYKIYNDISCGVEFVTLPIELGETFNKADVDYVADVIFEIMKGVKKRENLRKNWILSNYGYISTHISFTHSEKRDVPMPSKYIRNVIGNMISFYYPVVYISALKAGFNKTRSSYFRRYYINDVGYLEDKSDYPAVFIPSYPYNDLIPYHKIEFRVPDTLLLAKKKDIADLLDIYVRLIRSSTHIDDIKKRLYMNINKIVERRLGDKGSVFILNDDIVTLNVENHILESFVDEFREKIESM